MQDAGLPHMASVPRQLREHTALGGVAPLHTLPDAHAQGWFPLFAAAEQLEQVPLALQYVGSEVGSMHVPSQLTSPIWHVSTQPPSSQTLPEAHVV
jgi:hypothetical protein